MVKPKTIGLGIVVFVIIFLAIGLLMLQMSQTPQKDEKQLIVADSIFFLDPGGYWAFQFDVPPGVSDIRLIGHFSASGLIQAWVMDETAFIDWENGYTVKVLEMIEPTTETNIYIQLQASGSYCLLLDNTPWVFTSKTVDVQAKLYYTIG
ncbi:MAG: hypothetical protein L6N95_01475 [Candidatus Methylarchaceae archaeon HK01B]|nr:hypothetical protein [Candidatus Methylarchaceae archaeon HK01M]MCP8312032.1 hypothetical protein [Candidatus Methylarchaceae archaeon HK02M1]MCP8318483.1 hypothetical protein [Candidatus Methylarchaceae archaeon HK01B]